MSHELSVGYPRVSAGPSFEREHIDENRAPAAMKDIPRRRILECPAVLRSKDGDAQRQLARIMELQRADLVGVARKGQNVVLEPHPAVHPLHDRRRIR